MEQHSNTPPPPPGLLSPIPSFASLASLFTPSYSTPSTPIRSRAKTAHSSPLVKRLLLPFEPTTPTSTPTQAHSMPQNSSSSSATGPRSSTLSEKLLRDALKRDEGKHSTPSQTQPVDQASAGKHRRRHSHAPTPNNILLPSHDDLTKGSFLFRTPMSPQSAAGAPPSPSTSEGSDERMALARGSRPGHSKSQSVSVAPSYYGGDAERGSSPILPQNPSGHTSHRQSSVSRPRASSPATPSRSSHGHAGARSNSPSPLRRREASLHRHAPRSQAQAPTPARAPSNHPSGNSMYTQSPPPGARTPSRPSPSHHQRPEITESPSRGSRRSAPPPPIQLQTEGDTLEMTPHEQVLRARLERVLSVGRVVEKRERERRGRGSDADEYRFGVADGRRERTRDPRSRSRSGTNDVRDEEDGWPWRERERMTSSPLQSSSSRNSHDSSSASAASLYMPQSQSQSRASRSPARAYPNPTRPGTPSRSSSNHVRTRSKTDSTLPAAVAKTLASTPTPRRHSTAPTHTATAGSSRQRRRATGTTPPLVHGDVEEDEENDLKLLTPPSTPPFVAQAFNLGGVGAHTYYPSPYKTAFESPLGVKGKRMHGLGMGRPLGAPMHMSRMSSGDDDDSSSEPSSTHSRSPSRSRSSVSCGCPPDQQCLCPPVSVSGIAHPSSLAHHPHPYHSPQSTFNARKASARCRAIEGYVSFAAVEGLGEPPADPLSPVDDYGDGRQGQVHGGWGVNLRMGLKKFLGAVPGAHADEGQGERGVVL